MISIDPASQSERDNYKFMIGSIIPRPIAWVTTMTPSGTVNAAPFSYFNIVTSKPPMISVSVQRKNGVMKDTARNAGELGEFVVHIADERHVAQMNQTAANLGPEESEAEAAGLTTVPSEVVRVPGIAEAAIRMECKVERILSLGGTDDAPACDLLIGRIVRFHADEAVYDEHGHVDASALRPVSRLAGSTYALLGETFDLERP
ncbi:flavin reductase family protein [Paenibacillus rhizovicinus]|uniref:Flavin reductase family protein n=1 Tax=Paenibacillus rhizovicinus TaxID=2704463 RepID=A0A6C0P633_9BACL|nr:flavin reductase family protein [Paenibacillus rhizovicinus]QHW33905.1 flavin reductase family protein [Paenibacillus rhizovicinus]